MLIIVTLNPKFRAMQNRICDADRAANTAVVEAFFCLIYAKLKSGSDECGKVICSPK